MLTEEMMNCTRKLNDCQFRGFLGCCNGDEKIQLHEFYKGLGDDKRAGVLYINMYISAGLKRLEGERLIKEEGGWLCDCGGHVIAGASREELERWNEDRQATIAV